MSELDAAVDSVDVITVPEPVSETPVIVEDSSYSSRAKELGVPDDFLRSITDDDPDYFANNEISDKAKVSDQSTEEVSDDKNSGEKTDDTSAGEPKESKDTTVADDKNSSTESEDDFEFADNVIEGLKGEHLKALPIEAKEAIAEFYGKSTEATEELGKVKSKLSELLSDPVVKMRSEMLAQGRNQYDIRKITSEEKQTIISKLQEKIGLTEEEALSAYNELEPGLNSVAQERAESLFHSKTLEENTRRQIDEQTTKGRALLLGLGKFNKELAFKETDPNKFWKRNDDGRWILNETHPEIKSYEKKIVPILSAFAKSGMTYESLNKMAEEFGVEAVYAMAARKHNLPIAINTAERDRKIIQTELRKKLAPFIKNKQGPSELSTDSRSYAEKKIVNNVMKNGYDITKLATDPDYYDRALNEKQGDLKWASTISRLADEGAAYNKLKKK